MEEKLASLVYGGRMVKKTQQDNTEIHYVFDLAGRMTDKGRYDIQTAHTYADDGQPLTETLTIDGRSYTMERTYDSANRVETHKFADGKVMEWRYDDRNMVTKALYDGEEVLDQIHDDAYRLTNQTFGQDLERVITFGRQDNLRTNDHVKDGSQIIDELNFDYTYAADKNVLSETNPSGLLADLSFGVTYDDGNRVETWNRVADYLNARESQTWNYDDAGNWNATIIDGDLQNRTNNGSDELTSIEGNALTYDSRGNLLEDQDGQKYTWDIDNRIATIEPSGGSDEITHQYDAFSRRVHREFGNTDEVLLWWGKEEYAEHENIGAQPTIQNDLHANPTGLNTTFGRALEGSKHDIQYFHKNYLDHVYAVSDDRGDIIEHYRYTAFGEPEFYNESGEQLAGSAIDNDILWNVKRYSEASGLYMYLYRHYEAKHGRWPSRDPIAEGGGVNLYGFVGNKAINFLDIYGLSIFREPTSGTMRCVRCEEDPDGPVRCDLELQDGSSHTFYTNDPERHHPDGETHGDIDWDDSGEIEDDEVDTPYNFGDPDRDSTTYGAFGPIPPGSYIISPRTNATRNSTWPNGTPTINTPGYNNGRIIRGEQNSGTQQNMNRNRGSVLIHGCGASQGCFTTPDRNVEIIQEQLEHGNITMELEEICCGEDGLPSAVVGPPSSNSSPPTQGWRNLFRNLRRGR